MEKRFKLLISGLVTIFLLVIGLAFADSNGIWHNVEDIRGGVFGGDEQPLTVNYTFMNPVIFNSESLFNHFVQINSDLNVSGSIRTGGNLVATLDSSGKVPVSQLPFHKGDVISPTNRPLLSGLSNYDSDYFDITNLGISGLNAANVKAGVAFGLGNNILGSFTSDGTATSLDLKAGKIAYVNGVKVVGTLSSSSICSSAGGSATCGATSSLSPGTFYAIIGSNSATGTNYCSKIVVSSTGSVSSSLVASAGLCKLISSCDSSSQNVSNFADLTSCGGASVCQSGSCHTYSWQVGSYGACSVTCGGGVQTRPVSCKRDDGVIVGDSFCVNAGVKPTASLSCNTNSCVTVVSLSTFEGCGLYCGYSPSEGYYRLYGVMSGGNLQLTVTHDCRYPSRCGGVPSFSKVINTPEGTPISGNFNDLNGGSKHAWRYLGNCLYIYRDGNWNNRVGCFS